MDSQTKKQLKSKVEAVAALFQEIKDLQDDAKEIIADTKDSLGIAPAVVRKLAKEFNMNDLERSAQQLLEEELDACRTALGILSDMPLGQAAENATRRRSSVRETENA